MATLLDDIQTFLKSHDIPPTRFGELSMNDKAFVSRLEAGRRTWPETEEKVRAFMRDFVPPATSPTPSDQEAA